MLSKNRKLHYSIFDYISLLESFVKIVRPLTTTAALNKKIELFDSLCKSQRGFNKQIQFFIQIQHFCGSNVVILCKNESINVGFKFSEGSITFNVTVEGPK